MKPINSLTIWFSTFFGLLKDCWNCNNKNNWPKTKIKSLKLSNRRWLIASAILCLSEVFIVFYPVLLKFFMVGCQYLPLELGLFLLSISIASEAINKGKELKKNKRDNKILIQQVDRVHRTMAIIIWLTVLTWAIQFIIMAVKIIELSIAIN